MGRKPKERDIETWKQNVSKSRRAFAAKNLVPIPDKKRCTRCKKVKPQEEFSRTKKYVKAIEGEREYLTPMCRQCVLEKGRERKPEKVREYNRIAEKRRRQDPVRAEQRREYQREWAAAKRRQNGQRAAGSRKVREGPRSDLLPIGPIQQFLIDYFSKTPRPTIEKLSEDSGVPVERIRRIIAGREAEGQPLSNVTTPIVDKLLIGADAQYMFHQLYPLD